MTPPSGGSGAAGGPRSGGANMWWRVSRRHSGSLPRPGKPVGRSSRARRAHPARLLERCIELVGEDPFTRVRDSTRFAQPAIFCASVAAWMELAEHVRPVAFAGHSLGELSALVAADALDPHAGLELAVRRGELMGASETGEPEGMLAVLGASDEQLTVLAGESPVVLANDNAPGQAGARRSGEPAARRQGAGARVAGARDPAGCRRCLSLAGDGRRGRAFSRSARQRRATPARGPRHLGGERSAVCRCACRAGRGDHQPGALARDDARPRSARRRCVCGFRPRTGARAPRSPQPARCAPDRPAKPPSPTFWSRAVSPDRPRFRPRSCRAYGRPRPLGVRGLSGSAPRFPSAGLERRDRRPPRRERRVDRAAHRHPRAPLRRARTAGERSCCRGWAGRAGGRRARRRRDRPAARGDGGLGRDHSRHRADRRE